MSKDYYNILGVSKTATQDEIKQAFRKKAHEYHPDKGSGDDKKFKEVNEAYQVLKDDKKRQQYDRFGSAFGNQGAGPGGFGFKGASGTGYQDFSEMFRQGQGGGVEFDVGDIFDMFFGGGGGGGGGNRPRKGHDVQAEIAIPFAEAVSGTERTINVSGKDLKVKIPAGIDTGQSIRVRGEGGEGRNGGPKGDLYLVVRVLPDPNFTRQGFNIITRKHISIAQAALGDKVEVKTLDGDVRVKIPEGTQSHTKIRLKGKGIPHLHGRGRGDHFVEVIVDIPKKLSRKQKKLLEDFDQE